MKEFHHLISICLKQNVCVFKGKTYKFPDGLPMGGPLSMLVVDIFMGKLKTDILGAGGASQYIKFWTRYVDDIILCIWRGPDVEFRNFLGILNGYDPEMKFNAEISGYHINFRDLSISLVEHLNVLRANFGIYRKDSFTGRSTHAQSFHSAAHKMAMLNSAIHRMINLPLTAQAVDAETKRISAIAAFNGLKINTDSVSYTHLTLPTIYSV